MNMTQLLMYTVHVANEIEAASLLLYLTYMLFQ